MRLILIAAMILAMAACVDEPRRGPVLEKDAGAGDDVYVQPVPDEYGECPDDHKVEWLYGEPYRCHLKCDHEDDWCPPGYFCYVFYGRCSGI